MTTDIEDLLTRAADDSDRPLRDPIDVILRRGRRRVRERRIGALGLAAVTTLALAVGVTEWLPGKASTQPPAAGTTAAAQPPASLFTDAQIIAQCKKQDANFLRFAENKADGGTDPLDGWKVVLTQGTDQWFRAILLSPDGRRFARCQHKFGGTKPSDYYDRQKLGLSRDFVVWSSRDGAWGEIPAAVRRVTFQVGDGLVEEAAVTDGFYLWYALLPYEQVKDKPIWAVFYDATDRELARFNSNPPDGGTAMEQPRDPIFPK